jgi:hypothetical protein
VHWQTLPTTAGRLSGCGVLVEWSKMPQILMVDHYQQADVDMLALQLSGIIIDDWML